MPYNLRSQKTPKSELITIDVDVAVKKAKAEKAKAEKERAIIIEKEKIVTEQKISEILSNKNETFYEMENNIRLSLAFICMTTKKENKSMLAMQTLNFGCKLIETCYAFRFTLSDGNVDVKGFTPENTKRILTKFLDVYIKKIIDLLPELKEINTEYYLSANQYLVIAQDYKKMVDEKMEETR